MSNNALNVWRKCFQPRQWFGRGIDPESLSEEDMLMWVYKHDTTSDRYLVGFFYPSGEWFTESSYNTRDAAAARVHYLNGGSTTSKDDKPT